jgi:2'-5' RNA ligase
MKLAIVAFPRLNERDRQWIEAFRSRHDPQAFRLGVHFTLVFPVEATPHELEPELARVAQSFGPIPFAIRHTEVVRDGLTGDSHILLVPDEGGDRITALHDRLYAGALRAHLRADIPFIPHMTVGAAPDSASARGLATPLDVRARIVRGTVADIEMVDVGRSPVHSVKSYTLGSTRSSPGT